MIPKIIHYCWFGNRPLPETFKRNIDTWRRVMPNYEIMEWNENNFDCNQYEFSKNELNESNYGHLSDIVRLKILYDNGGIYMDTDVEAIKSLDNFLDNDAFMSYETDEKKSINTGCFGVSKNSVLIKGFFEKYYKNAKSIDDLPYAYNSWVLGDFINKNKDKYKILFLDKDILSTLANGIKSNTCTYHKWQHSWVNSNVLSKYNKSILNPSIKINEKL